MLILNRYNRQITAPPLKHILGIDQLRYIFALWVFFFHGGLPPLFAGHVNTKAFEFLEHLYGWLINGQAAVICFFIISGLCIHYPNIRRNSLDLKSFYTARFLRLSLPLIACLIIGKLANFQHPNGFLRVVPIWTLYCEGFYYLIYPLILVVIKKGMLIQLILLMSLISIVLIITWAADRQMYFHEIGDGGFLDWKPALLAFPCWLAGVLIAERVSDASNTNKISNDKQNPLLRWRLGALFFSGFTFPLYRLGLYLKIVTLPFIGLIFTTQFTILLFGLYAFFWIEKEVLYHNFGNAESSVLLERFGLASYSLYLIHTLVFWAFNKYPAAYFPGYLIFWILMLATLHLIVYAFYIIIEKPSHKLAKFCANKLRN
ncbi:peptidoglycan/LPS O-acetylase OafA/YrhL [Mucilaginibacter frigoritolerans]|uniref:Peptidoglycan/LPS O-acetylase OafA/YrhL n=1 Tax=Mucilaginibacter frigoritolerans TaxID=652788 RepID=A0A562U4N6_9SPHI|nr:acyltransferase [Mucilaginibacter frigoritolerans]TWJ00796.1 peptidoglycan/LPS O-acetylase OafA/YrhL [Mucilaginibacter frigoritolerans]